LTRSWKLNESSSRFRAPVSLGLKQLKMQEALTWIKEDQASIGYGAEYAGVSSEEMAKYAYSQGVKPAFSEETIDEELGNQ